jgi:enoyl-CoA hydratase/carnithine racemase
MPPVNLGLHHPGMGSLLRAKIQPAIRRKVLLEAHRYTATEALKDGIVDAAASPDDMFDVAMELARKWKGKAKMGVYGVLRDELVGEASKAYRDISYVHSRETTREPKVKI